MDTMSEARPDWLTDAMLAEMRRLKGTDDQSCKSWSGDLEIILTQTRGREIEPWVNGFNPPQGENVGWLTREGHKALAAIEVEELSRDGLMAALLDVVEFHEAIPDSTVKDRGSHKPALTRRSMRHRLLREEFDELTDAMLENDLVETADAYADMIYVLLGSAVMHFGAVRFARVWNEVHRSNMAKLIDGKLVMREDGKVLKPDGWTPPNVSGALWG